MYILLCFQFVYFERREIKKTSNTLNGPKGNRLGYFLPLQRNRLYHMLGSEHDGFQWIVERRFQKFFQDNQPQSINVSNGTREKPSISSEISSCAQKLTVLKSFLPLHISLPIEANDYFPMWLLKMKSLLTIIDPQRCKYNMDVSRRRVRQKVLRKS